MEQAAALPGGFVPPTGPLGPHGSTLDATVFFPKTAEYSKGPEGHNEQVGLDVQEDVLGQAAPPLAGNEAEAIAPKEECWVRPHLSHNAIATCLKHGNTHSSNSISNSSRD